MKPLYIGNDSHAISVLYQKKDDTIYLSGYFDHCVGIEGKTFDLCDFLDLIGVKKTRVDKIRKAKHENKTST